MSLMTKGFRLMAKSSDAIRDRGLLTPEDIERCNDIDYVGDGITEHLLDVYYPKVPTKLLPTIVSIHGGGWVYGSKEIYQFYGMNLAQRGFAFVNFNYRLAPNYRYPSPLEDTAKVFSWLRDHAKDCHIDLENIFMVGDSAGAQLACQYAAICTNPDYAKRFKFKTTSINIKALALNCGVYDPFLLMAKKNGKPSGLVKDYFGKDYHRFIEEVNYQNYITSDFPPCFVMTSLNDSLSPFSLPFVKQMSLLNIPHLYKEYGQNDPMSGHVFHVNIRNDEAKRCNDDEIDFFKSFI